MSSDLTKKAVKMLLNGARMLSEPCPYCKGVRVMKDGYALCVNCGKEPEITQTEPELTKVQNTESTQSILENKLQDLSKELEKEKDHEKQQQILKSINSLVEILAKLKN
ncbi:hypothetical protein MnTg01_00220 [archaeon MnTg01]|nr:hypothetical protein MnTg01_00220 [archaeon MnTg01]